MRYDKTIFFAIHKSMARGLWNKIKQGFKKVGNAIRKGVDFVREKVIKPVTDTVIKPFRPFISGALGAVKPQYGAIADKVMDSVERFSDEGFTPFRRLKRD